MKSNRVLIFSVFVLALIIATGTAIKMYLSKSTALLLDELSATEEYINTGRWAEAQNSISRLNSDWEKLENKWTVFTSHDEIDNITVTLKTTYQYINARDTTLTMGSLSSLKHFISHIPEMEDVSIKNIF